MPEDKSSEFIRPEKPESISTKGQSAQAEAFRIKVPGKLRSDFDISQTTVEKPEAASRLTPGMLVDGKYRLLRPIGQGGMGVVWLVEHVMLKRELALKTLVHSRMSQAVYERFAKEIRTTSQLDHPNLVKVFDCGLLPDGTPYYTMEYAAGHSLRQYLDEKGPMPLRQCLEVFVDVAGALSYAHRHNTLHRDIKPDNIVLVRNGEGFRAQVLDFGLAKFVHSGLKPITESTAGDYIGSPPYMSPEQCMGKDLDYRSDVYSLGCALFQALTGVLPFESKNHLAIIQMHLSERPPSLQQAANGEQFPEPIEIIVSRMLAKDPKQRCRSMEEVERLLKLYLRGKFTAGTRSGTEQFDNDYTDTQSHTNNNKSDYSGPLLIAAILGIILLGGAGLTYFLLQPPTAKVVEAKPDPKPKFATLLSSPPVAGEQFRRFHFPIEISSGKFEAVNSDFKREARGETEIPVNALVIFEPSREFLKDPAVLTRFRPDDLVGLVLNKHNKANDDALLACTALFGLKHLSITSPMVTDRGLAYVASLNELKWLDVGDADISGKQLSLLPCLRNLNFLRLDTDRSSPDFSETFKALHGSKNLYTLSARTCDVCDQDMVHIASCTNLTELILSSNLGLTEEGLKQLAALKNLKHLRLTNIPLKPGIISTLSQLKHLKVLHISSKNWSEKDKARLKETLPADCELTWSEWM